MNDSGLAAWKQYCQHASTREADADGAVLESDWAGAGITPPPARGAPIARLPLDRALELVDRAENPGEEDRDELLRQAAEWLAHPHPRTPPELMTAIRRQRARIGGLLDV